MDLATNFAAPFTRWVVASGFLQSRFVLVDVGVQRGIHERWAALGHTLEVHGFDPLVEAIAPLRAVEKSHYHYYEVALGSAEGTATLHIAPDPCGSSLYDHSDGRPTRTVNVTTLDTLFRRGTVPPADFIKLDCEGYEPEVLKGAPEYLSASSMLGAEVETNFNISPVLPETHFWETYRPLLDSGMLLFDVEFERSPRPSFSGTARRARPGTWEILLARDLPFERGNGSSFKHLPRLPSQDDILKSAIIFEIYDMIDVAYDTLAAYRDRLTVDSDHAISLLHV